MKSKTIEPSDELTAFLFAFKKAQEIGVYFSDKADEYGNAYNYEVNSAAVVLLKAGKRIQFGPAIDARRPGLEFRSDWPFDLEMGISVPGFKRTHFLHLFADWDYGHAGDPGTFVDIDIVLKDREVIRLFTDLQLNRKQTKVLSIEW